MCQCPQKSEFFFFAFLDESDHLQCFPNAFRKNPKKSKKKFGIGQDPPPPVWKISKLFRVFFLKASLREDLKKKSKKGDIGQKGR